MSNDFEVIVVGAGGMGASSAYHLAAAGRAVLLIEQFEIGHNRGASHGESRIIRLSYDHPDYVRLSQAAYALWSEFETACGEEVVFKTGGLDLSVKGNPAFEACSESMTAVGVAHELIDAAEIRRRFPQFRLEEGMVGVYQKDAGIVSPAQIVPLLCDMAARHGAVVKDRTPVTSVYFDEAGVEVKAGDEIYRADKLVLSPGPWAEPLLQKVGLKIPVTVTQENYLFLKPADEGSFAVGTFPIFAQYGTNRNGPDIEFYGFPIFGRDGVKVAEHHFGPTVTADDREFVVPPAIVERMRARTRALLPDADGEVLHSATCLYSNTFDRHFIVDMLPGYPDVVVAAGFSGHGFKFAIAIGRMVADLVERQETTLPSHLFSLSRFDVRA